MNNLERKVIQRIGENADSPDVFTADSDDFAVVRGSVNNAIQELCMLTGSYTKIYHLTLLENRQFYRIAAQQDHFGYVVEAWDRNRGMKLRQTDALVVSKRDPWWMKRPGGTAPEEYGHLGSDHIFIYPYTSSKGLVLELRCVMIPKAYTEDTDEIKLREQFQRAAVSLAVSEYYATRGNATRAGEFLKEYLEIAKLKQLHPSTADRQYRMGGFDYGRNINTVDRGV